MKKYRLSLLFAFALCGLTSLIQAEPLTSANEMVAVIDFTPSNNVIIDYYAGNNGSIAGAGSSPQQYLAVSKHTYGNRVCVTTELSGLACLQDDAWMGVSLAPGAITGLPDYSGYLGANLERINSAGWIPL